MQLCYYPSYAAGVLQKVRNHSIITILIRLLLNPLQLKPNIALSCHVAMSTFTLRITTETLRVVLYYSIAKPLSVAEQHDGNSHARLLHAIDRLSAQLRRINPIQWDSAITTAQELSPTVLKAFHQRVLNLSKP